MFILKFVLTYVQCAVHAYAMIFSSLPKKCKRRRALVREGLRQRRVDASPHGAIRAGVPNGPAGTGARRGRLGAAPQEMLMLVLPVAFGGQSAEHVLGRGREHGGLLGGSPLATLLAIMAQGRGKSIHALMEVRGKHP